MFWNSTLVNKVYDVKEGGAYMLQCCLVYVQATLNITHTRPDIPGKQIVMNHWKTDYHYNTW